MADERWRITVDKGTCIGSTVCVGTAPPRFALDAAELAGCMAVVVA